MRRKFSARLHSAMLLHVRKSWKRKDKITQGICKGLRVLQNVYTVVTLINEYDGDVPVFHFDAIA